MTGMRAAWFTALRALDLKRRSKAACPALLPSTRKAAPLPSSRPKFSIPASNYSVRIGNLTHIIRVMQTGEYQMYFWPLRKEREARTRQQFPDWKSITLGMCKTADEYRKALKQARISIRDWGNDILDRIACSHEEIEVDLVVLSVYELGFYRSAKYKDLCAKAL